jgi:hypothetical protein
MFLSRLGKLELVGCGIPCIKVAHKSFENVEKFKSLRITVTIKNIFLRKLRADSIWEMLATIPCSSDSFVFPSDI